MGTTGVGEDLDVSTPGGGVGVSGITVGRDLGGVFGGNDVPGANVGFFLGNEVLGFDRDDAVFFLEDKPGVDGFGGSERQTRQRKGE